MLTDELTSQEAADLVGVSRPFLVKNLRPYRMIGNRRRYRRADVVAYGLSLRSERNQEVPE